MSEQKKTHVRITKDQIEFDSKGRVIISDPAVTEFLNSSLHLFGEAVLASQAGTDVGCVDVICWGNSISSELDDERQAPNIHLNIGNLDDLTLSDKK